MTIKWKELVDTDGKSGKFNTCKGESKGGGSTTPSTPTWVTKSFH
jgi:hypothetical protein